MTETTSAPTQTEESVEEFAARARAWLAENMPRIDPDGPPEADRGEEAPWLRARELQKMLWDGGFAGICFPKEYGGLSLPIAYQKAFDNESRSYELPIILNTPTFTICAATILDTDSEEQKRQHISGALRGDEVLVQLLSEPSGGSDLAGIITRAERVGDKWVINGAKTWSTSAFAADYRLMLARTNWDVPKHEGLTMCLVPINSPGITLRRIKQVTGRSSSARSSSTTSSWVTTPSLAKSTRAGTSPHGSSTTSDARSAAAPSSPVALAPKAKPTCPSTTSPYSRRRGRPTTNAAARWRAGRWCTGQCGSS